MKSVKEVEDLLVLELNHNLNKINLDHDLEFYNEVLGDTSFLLAGLLHLLLKERCSDWDSKKWIDDSLITDLKKDERKIVIQGVMIWGKEDEIEQWIDPFYFEILLDKTMSHYSKYKFLFGVLGAPEVNYRDFDSNRRMWNNLNLNETFDGSTFNWRYSITS